MTLNELRHWVFDKCNKHPELKNEMLDYLTLCIDEIDEGGSVEHEIELCINDIEELIDENTSND
jgi:hypothetical protein